MRPAWRSLHLVFGLALGGFFALLGITGSLLVFYVEIDRWQHPIPVHGELPGVPLEAFVVRLVHTFPERADAWRIDFPAEPDAPITARYYKPLERADRDFAPLLVTLDPKTTEVVRQRFWGEDWLTWTYDLHYTLLADKPGRWAVGALGLALLLSLGSGLVLAWPTRRRWRQALRLLPRPGTARATYDLHVTVGSYGALLLLVVSCTGTVLAWPEWMKPAIARVSRLHEMPTVRSVPTGAPRMTLDVIVAAAQRRFPGATLAWVETPSGAVGVYRVNLHQVGEPGRRFPRTNVWLDQYSGAVLATRDALQDAGGDVFLNWMHPLHNGEALGLTGRLLVLVGGLLPTVLLGTGILRWRQKVTARKRVARRERNHPDGPRPR